jgi:hypothetical protein
MKIQDYEIPVYALGPDFVSQEEIEGLCLTWPRILWIAYSYEVGCYEGHGLAIVKRDDGTFLFWGMGHCSCYGPCERVELMTVSLEALLDDTVEEYPALYAKLKELTK